MKFLSTPSARRATFSLSGVTFVHFDFYPRPPRGGRPIALMTLSSSTLFLSTPSARRATQFSVDCVFFVIISIHALREEGDRGMRRGSPDLRNFYPRPPRGGRRIFGIKAELAVVISIHALREEGDSQASHCKEAGLYFYPRPPRGGRPRVSRAATTLAISIHALREEGDQAPDHRAGRHAISIHALREEGDKGGCP